MEDVCASPAEIRETTAQGKDAFSQQPLVEDLLLMARCEVLLHSSWMVRL